MRAAPRTLFFRLLVLTLPVEFLVLALFGVWLVHRTERRDLAAFDDRLRIQTQAMLSGVGLDPEGRLRVDADLNGRALAPGGRAVVLDQRGLILWESPPGWFEAGGIAPYSQQVQEYLRTLRVRGAVFRILDSATRVRRPQDGDEPTGPLVEAIVAQPLSGLVEGQAVFRERAMAVGLLLLALTAALLWVAIRAGLSPIRAMERRLQAVPGPAGRERLDEALVPEELRPLAREINGLLDRVWELVQREKRFAAEAAHELRTPLTLVKSTLQTALLTSGSREEGERALQEALEDLQRLEETAESLLTLARADALLPEGPRRLEEVSLPELLGSLAERYAAAASAKGQTIALELDAASIRGDRAALERLFGNLLDNAVKYSGPRGSITLRCESAEGAVLAAVEDGGPPIPADDRPHLFRQFFRGAATRAADVRGSGLGLAIASAVARLHGAEITWERCGEEGNRFTVRFPSPARRRQDKG